ncbi:hypothetical protein HaLaN_29562, partial [Haematococcus lacustris]
MGLASRTVMHDDKWEPSSCTFRWHYQCSERRQRFARPTRGSAVNTSPQRYNLAITSTHQTRSDESGKFDKLPVRASSAPSYECDSLISSATPRLARSGVSDANTGEV